ncbi:hypothetical protein CYLTODRAFT_459002 [Cylindrobasidium torrendii FP15055 ss-10]|uniref:Uncharacterized protein n=1 Tax=Cylindrobasidium torrendii FP15055 ss-10 TaxID=1314674 RepID=A0A0D7AVK4_9AGAR|nr:hypothetical protein CYLTODRAFT_459002 [Cylindrobasidium torrendii FP15055 ss-10]
MQRITELQAELDLSERNRQLAEQKADEHQATIESLQQQQRSADAQEETSRLTKLVEQPQKEVRDAQKRYEAEASARVSENQEAAEQIRSAGERLAKGQAELNEAKKNKGKARADGTDRQAPTNEPFVEHNIEYNMEIDAPEDADTASPAVNNGPEVAGNQADCSPLKTQADQPAPATDGLSDRAVRTDQLWRRSKHRPSHVDGSIFKNPAGQDKVDELDALLASANRTLLDVFDAQGDSPPTVQDVANVIKEAQLQFYPLFLDCIASKTDKTAGSPSKKSRAYASGTVKYYQGVVGRFSHDVDRSIFQLMSATVSIAFLKITKRPHLNDFIDYECANPDDVAAVEAGVMKFPDGCMDLYLGDRYMSWKWNACAVANMAEDIFRRKVNNYGRVVPAASREVLEAMIWGLVTQAQSSWAAATPRLDLVTGDFETGAEAYNRAVNTKRKRGEDSKKRMRKTYKLHDRQDTCAKQRDEYPETSSDYWLWQQRGSLVADMGVDGMSSEEDEKMDFDGTTITVRKAVRPRWISAAARAELQAIDSKMVVTKQRTPRVSHITRHTSSEPHVCIELHCRFKSASLRDLFVHRQEAHHRVKRETVSPSGDPAAKEATRSTATRRHCESGLAGNRRREKDEISKPGPAFDDERPRTGARSVQYVYCRQDASGQTTACNHWGCAFRARKDQEAAQDTRRGRVGNSPGPSSSRIAAQSNGTLQKRKREDAATDAFLPSSISASDDDSEPMRIRRRLQAPSANADEYEQENIEEDEMDMLNPTRYSQSLDVLPEVRLPSPPKRRTTRAPSVKEEEVRNELDTLSQAGCSKPSVAELHEAVARQEKMVRQIRRNVKNLCRHGLRIEVAWEDARPFVRDEMQVLGEKFRQAISKAFAEQPDA